MTVRRPPTPYGDDWKSWAAQLHRFLLDEQAAPVQATTLPRLTPQSRAGQDGILLWDAENSRVVVSRAGAWRPLQEVTP